MTLSERLADALCATHRLLSDAPTEGRKRLFEAVSEAFAYLPRPLADCVSASAGVARHSESESK